MILKALLYENQAIYIISSVGNQSKETFQKIEEIILRIGKTSASINSLKDIAEKEIKRTPSSKTGFIHDPTSYRVEFFNGSAIYTLNSKPDNARSRRATMVFFDEAAFCSDELIVVCEAFAAQNTSFITDIDSDYNEDAVPLKVPTQLVYASSQGDMGSLFYRHYKDFAKQMIIGNRDYFVCDMICDVAMNVYIDGRPYKPLLTQSVVDSEMRADRDRALREYYNKPVMDGGITQIVKWGTIRRNERDIIPFTKPPKAGKIALAFDPSRTTDNSILTAMHLYEDPEIGWCGDIVGCVNMVDEASEKHYKLDSARQLENLRNTLIKYNGHNTPDYENIDCLLIDQGSGGGGTSTYADSLMANWVDGDGREHRGLIDLNHEIYKGYGDLYPEAIDKLRLISPRKYRTQMVEEMIELMNIGVIHFPYAWNGKQTISKFAVDTKTGEEIMEEVELSMEQQIALAQIDLMKTEVTSIHKSQNQEKTSVLYAVTKEKQNTVHDDRFYTLILLAHRLYELRRKSQIKRSDESEFTEMPVCISTIEFDS